MHTIIIVVDCIDHNSFLFAKKGIHEYLFLYTIYYIGIEYLVFINR